MLQSSLALTLAVVAAGIPSSRLASAVGEPAPFVVRPPFSVHAGDKLARTRLTYLATRSATMQQILEVLDLTPAVSVRLRSNTMLWRSSRRRGVGRFWLEGPHIVALLQFDSGSARPLQELESVAHEMAHAVEVACLPRLVGIDKLRSQLLRRGRTVPDTPGLTIETPFAADAGRRIVLEALRGRPDIGRLPELAEKYNLGPPCAEFTGKTRNAPAPEWASAIR
jgi:hypothetical protein